MALNFRQVVFSVIVLGGIGAAVYEMNKPQQVPVDIMTLTRGPLEVTVNGDGMTRIKDVFEVSAPVSGQVLRSPVEIGDQLEAGESIVARIQPGEPAFLDERARMQAEATISQAEAALTLAAANVRAAEADLGNAQRQLARVVSLHEKGTISEAQLEEAGVGVDLAAAKLDSAHATVEMRESELAAARAVLIAPHAEGSDVDSADCCIDLAAPVSGQVLSITNESARMVAAGTPLLTIGPRNDLEITVDLLSTDAVRIGPGARAYVERWGGDETLEAVVREIEPAAFTKVSALGIGVRRGRRHGHPAQCRDRPAQQRLR